MTRSTRIALVVVLTMLLGALGVMPAQAATPGTKNGTLSAGGENTFDCFMLGGWGDHTVSLQAIAGRDGTGRAARLTLSNFRSGDRKFMSQENDACAPAVTPGQKYDLSVQYISTDRINLSVMRRTAAGWTYWTEAAILPKRDAWTLAKATTPTVPEGTDAIAWGVTLSDNGSVSVDDFSTVQTGGSTPPPPPPPTSTVTNGGLEAGASVPDCFSTAGWGDHTLSQGFSTDTASGSGRSWSITMANRTSGDRKLVPAERAGCAPDVVPGEAYDLSIAYKSTVPVSMSVYRQTASGWEYWRELVFSPARASWGTAVGRTPLIPAGTARLSFGMTISTNGTLKVDDFKIVKVQAPKPPPDDDPVNITNGRWTVQNYEMPNRNLHFTLLQNGKVLLIAGDGNNGYLYATKNFTADIWDPTTRSFKSLKVPADFFCAGHVTLDDGRVLIMGGTKDFADGAQPFTGLRDSFIFDPATETFTRVNDAIDGHWYPTLTKLGNGDVYATGGYSTSGGGSTATELFRDSESRWLSAPEVKQANTYWGTYPAMHLLSDGRLFYSGVHTFNAGLPGSGASLYDIGSGVIQDVPGLRDKDLRDQGASVLLPPAQDQRVMVTGGGYTDFNATPSKLTDVIDLTETSPGYHPAGDLPTAKMYVNSVILPDRTVLSTGGGANVRANDVIGAEIFDPATEKWTPVASDPVGRGYHSGAVLLPDGRVVALGGNPADNSFEMRISVYEPGYMFQPRPTLGVAPGTVAYGATATVPFTVPAGTSPQHVSLLAPMSVTHQSDPNARLVNVPFTASGGTLTLRIPDNRNLLPPGPYMLVVTNSDDVPSIAKWVIVK